MLPPTADTTEPHAVEPGLRTTASHGTTRWASQLFEGRSITNHYPVVPSNQHQRGEGSQAGNRSDSFWQSGSEESKNDEV